MSDLADLRAKLVARFDELPDRPDFPEDVDELEHKIDVTVALIHWIDEHPTATIDEYRVAMRQMRARK
jgi:hypothetical protein